MFYRFISFADAVWVISDKTFEATLTRRMVGTPTCLVLSVES